MPCMQGIPGNDFTPKCLQSFGKGYKLEKLCCLPSSPAPVVPLAWKVAVTRLLLVLLGGLCCVLLTGCDSKPPAEARERLVDKKLSPEELRQHIDRELDFAFHHRRLNTTDHAAWQIVHGALAYEQEFLIEADGKTVRAIDYLLTGGKMNGWSIERGDVLDEATGRRGVRTVLELGSKIGQGHPDQWLGYLQDCDLPIEATVMIDGHAHTVADWVEQIERDVYRNPNREFSWTLMALTKYRPTTHTWKAADGSEWSIARLLEIELEEGIEGVACGGTHRMVAITHAYNRHKEAGHPIDGVWKRAEVLIKDCKQNCRKFQNPDGSLSANFFTRPGQAIEIGDKLHCTGHQFEFLVVSMSDDELQQDFVRRAAINLTETLRKTQRVPLECGALYHAIRGLALYRERLYGPKEYAVNVE